jgi:hypothetical protein
MDYWEARQYERLASLASKRETDVVLFIKFRARFAGTVQALVLRCHTRAHVF